MVVRGFIASSRDEGEILGPAGKRGLPARSCERLLPSPLRETQLREKSHSSADDQPGNATGEAGRDGRQRMRRRARREAHGPGPDRGCSSGLRGEYLAEFRELESELRVRACLDLGGQRSCLVQRGPRGEEVAAST